MFINVSIIETFSSYMVYPLLRVQRIVFEPITSWLGRYIIMHNLDKVVEDLKKKNDEIVAENIALKALRNYSEEIGELYNFKKKYLLNRGSIAQVLARHFSPNNQFFLVDAGRSHGIKKNMIALWCNSIVGKVVEVYPWYCKVSLITDADCKVVAVCSQGNVTGIHEGINEIDRTIMRYVSHLESVCIDDLVLSSGEGFVFPKGFALGKIISVTKGELFYTIMIRPTLDFQGLQYCTLIAKEDI
ncbi:MAG TPA: rod shape-determining protein MreC [Candidatus Babeliales bacterium]|nr:rod shape-determining protein MreC [Candidatus Babeliales bacterium]